jgi:hypothetical protein
MKKKSLFLLLLLLLPTAKPYGQMIVTDPPQILASFATFLQSLEQAVSTTSQVSTIYGEAKSMGDNIKKTIALVVEVRGYVTTSVELIEATEALYDITKEVADAYSRFVKSGSYSMADLTSMLDTYSSILSRATYEVKTIKDMVLPSGSGLTNKERFDRLKDAASQVKYLSWLVKDYNKKMEGIGKDEEERKEAAKASAMTMTEAYVIEMKQLPVPVGVKLEMALEKILLKDKQTTEAQAMSNLKAGSTPYFTIFYAICAIIGLIGAYKVYVKVQLGEELIKGVFGWFATSLTLFIAGILVQQIFFTGEVRGEGITLSNLASLLRAFFDTLYLFLYAAAAITGLVGGLHVYSKWNAGEANVPKLVGMWAGVVIFLVAAGVFLQIFFAD